MTWILFSLSFFNADSKYVDSHGDGVGNIIFFSDQILDWTYTMMTS